MTQNQHSIWDVISHQMVTTGVKIRADVREIYLSNLNLLSEDFTRRNLASFRYLKILWLNNNQLEHVDFLGECYNLEELYLQDNNIYYIDKQMQHLHSLRVLNLQKNQLRNVQTLLHEFRLMHHLKQLNFKFNPVSQEDLYREQMICALKSLELLDHEQITVIERINALNIVKRRMLQTDKSPQPVYNVAFGSRYEPLSQGVRENSNMTTSISPFEQNNATNYLEQCPQEEDYENEEDLASMRTTVTKISSKRVAKEANARMNKKSLYEITKLDWSKIPRARDVRRARCDNVDNSSANNPMVNNGDTSSSTIVAEMYTIRMQF